MEVLKSIKEAAQEVNLTYGYGYRRDFNESLDARYPLIWVLPLNVSLTLENSIPYATYTITGFCLETAGKNGLTHASNKAIVYFTDFVYNLDRNNELFNIEGITYEILPERFGDNAYGLGFSFTIGVYEKVNC